MGAVRDTIAGNKLDTPSPLNTLRDVREQLYDLLQRKARDLADEGTAQATKNQASIDLLVRAIGHVKNAILELEAY